jgi:hypothetical protein
MEARRDEQAVILAGSHFIMVRVPRIDPFSGTDSKWLNIRTVNGEVGARRRVFQEEEVGGPG